MLAIAHRLLMFSLAGILALREVLGLLLRQYVLLGKDGRLCGPRSPVDRADDSDNRLAAGARRRCRILGVFFGPR
jgi:hypothetical protein